MDELLRTPIAFTGADGSSVHSPLIRANVGEIETLFVLDTGSDVHLLTKELADAVGLTLAEGEEGVDHAGATMPSWTAGDVPIRIEALDLVLSDVAVIPAPQPFVHKRIGGILSPQHLHATAWVVLDLAGDQLLLLEGADDAVVAALRERAPALRLLALDRDGVTATVVVRAAIKGFTETAVLLNSGGKRTEFDVAVVPDLAPGEAERLGGGVSGADVMGSLVSEQVLVAADAELRVPQLALREQMHYPFGQVGMDVLRGSVLTCNADPGGRVFWQVSPAGSS